VIIIHNSFIIDLSQLTGPDHIFIKILQNDASKNFFSFMVFKVRIIINPVMVIKVVGFFADVSYLVNNNMFSLSQTAGIIEFVVIMPGNIGEYVPRINLILRLGFLPIYLCTSSLVSCPPMFYLQVNSRHARSSSFYLLSIPFYTVITVCYTNLSTHSTIAEKFNCNENRLTLNVRHRSNGNS